MRCPATIVISLLLWLTPISAASARTWPVHDTAGLLAAIRMVRPGGEIVLADGVYVLQGNHGVDCIVSGTPAKPITVRAARPLRAHIVSFALEAFSVSAPNWHFEDLDIRGACADDTSCEHAFHVVGPATGFQLLRTRIADFNAQIKVNAGADHRLPDGGLVAGNQFLDTHPRNTANPVAPVNIDVASDWIVRDNVVSDFRKTQGNQVSYGIFAKGGAHRPIFERNLILCAFEDPSGGARIGLSFGAGGMDPGLCPPAWNAAVPCNPEVAGGIMRNNIVVNCSDDGIYLNDAQDTQLLYNTLIATQGIAFRFDGSTGKAYGNVLSSKIRTLQGGRFIGADNLTEVPMQEFDTWYRAPVKGDLRRKGNLGRLIQTGAARGDVLYDYCGRKRTGSRFDLGALQASLGDCVTTRTAPSVARERVRLGRRSRSP